MLVHFCFNARLPVVQVSVLTDQVEVQGEKIRDLDTCLEHHRDKLNATEELLQQVASTTPTRRGAGRHSETNSAGNQRLSFHYCLILQNKKVNMEAAD